MLRHGKPVALNNDKYQRSALPRTAIAVDRKGKQLWLIVVDGRQPFYSEGITLAELTETILNLGADAALNLDGGGSTTLVVADGKRVRSRNAPIHTRIPMRQRPVANHVGIYARPISSRNNWELY